MKKLLVVTIVIALLTTLSVWAYGAHEEGYMGNPSIQYKLDNSIGADKNTASASTWTFTPASNVSVSAEFFWEDYENHVFGSFTMGNGNYGSISISPSSLAGTEKYYYQVTSYHIVNYNGGTYTQTLNTYVP